MRGHRRRGTARRGPGEARADAEQQGRAGHRLAAPRPQRLIRSPLGPADRYAAVPYPSFPHPAGDPDRLALVARLHGLNAPDPDRARIVELGCGDGGNLLAAASAFPTAAMVGVDAAPDAVARGRELAAEAGLQNVDLRAADLRDLRAPELGPADYVVVHGLWSWVPDDVRERALALAAAIVEDHGVVSLSYNALPGWHLWRAPREIARRAAADEEDPERATAAAVEALREAARLHGRDDAYGHTLAAAVERARNRDPVAFFHDDLADESRPFALGDVVEHAAAHGLGYLGEALPAHWWAWRLPLALSGSIRDGGATAWERQRAADLASGVDFKATLLVPEGARPAPAADPVVAAECRLGPAPGGPPLPDDTAPMVRELLEAVDPDRSGELLRTVREAGAEVGLSPVAAGRAALRLTADEHAILRLRPPRAAAEPGERPRASSLARAQARRGDRVATLLHTHVTLDEPVVRALVSLLDGTRDRVALRRELLGSEAEREFEVAVTALDSALDGLLDRLGRVGLLEPASGAPRAALHFMK